MCGPQLTHSYHFIFASVTCFACNSSSKCESSSSRIQYCPISAGSSCWVKIISKHICASIIISSSFLRALGQCGLGFELDTLLSVITAMCRNATHSAKPLLFDSLLFLLHFLGTFMQWLNGCWHWASLSSYAQIILLWWVSSIYSTWRGISKSDFDGWWWIWWLISDC